MVIIFIVIQLRFPGDDVICRLTTKLQQQRRNNRLIMTSPLRSSKNIVEVLNIGHQSIKHRFCMATKG